MQNLLKLFAVFSLISFISWGIYLFANTQKRYQDFIFEDIRKRTFSYADTLELDFYDAPEDRIAKKPLVIMVHGGGFAGGQRNGSEEVAMGTYLAKKGFAVASIDYRLTRYGESFGCDCPAFAKLTTFVSASEDVAKAMSYLVERSDDLKIDAQKIILMGSSAGAEAILNTLILKDHPLFKHITFPPSKIIGAVSFSGAVIDASYINEDNAVPILFFHGRKDTKVPYGDGTHHFCPTDAPGYLVLDGPLEIIAGLKELEASYTVLSDANGGHEWADLAYQYPSTVANFLYRNVLKGDQIQQVLEISKTIKEK